MFDGSGADLFKRVADMGLEGIVAKRIDRPYRSGRGETWIKVKAKRKMTLPIIGYVPAGGSSIAALRLGRTRERQARLCREGRNRFLGEEAPKTCGPACYRCTARPRH